VAVNAAFEPELTFSVDGTERSDRLSLISTVMPPEGTLRDKTTVQFALDFAARVEGLQETELTVTAAASWMATLAEEPL
jgi:hypothetical protein